MSVITEFTIPAEAFALGQAMETVPDATIEIERHATHSREWIMPFVWTTGDDTTAIGDALRADPTTQDVHEVETSGSIGQFRVEWREEFQDVIDDIVDQHGIIQEAEATNGRWYLKLKFIDRDAVRAFQAYFDDRGYEFELERLYDATAVKEREYDLTPEQHTALITALELGYFAVPRKTQIGDLATELEISTSAVSQRLRRGTRNLTRNTLTIDPPDTLTDEE